MSAGQWGGSIRKMPMVIPVSREVLLDHGVVKPTEAEKAEREARYVDLRAEHEVARRETAAWLERLVAITDPVSIAVLDLHSQNENHDCEGCDFDGYEAEAPQWPCRTVHVVANLAGCPAPAEVAFNEWPRR